MTDYEGILETIIKGKCSNIPSLGASNDERGIEEILYSSNKRAYLSLLTPNPIDTMLETMNFPVRIDLEAESQAGLLDMIDDLIRLPKAWQDSHVLTVETGIDATSDDANALNPSGAGTPPEFVDNDATTLKLSYTSDDYYYGALRFVAPAGLVSGGTVTVATLTVTGYDDIDNQGRGTTDFELTGYDVDDIDAFVDDTTIDYTGRYTTADTSLAVGGLVVLDTEYDINVLTVVQEIVARAGFENHLGFLMWSTALSVWNDYTYIYSWDGDRGKSPVLSLTYEFSGSQPYWLEVRNIHKIEKFNEIWSASYVIDSRWFL